ncbi:terminase small subunit [Providencia phage PSTCR4]|uniref:Terminase small subunit n=1 Tax=Providencia phage PSTCR4 TaxID=2783546 RepID=A0A873WN93_9CAUD|nr:terminase small subunit [Providencia phage PSTCR4]QPB12039.1 hypothetical protein [Providencia phage PSTCR4]
MSTDWTNGAIYTNALTEQEKSVRETVARQYMYDRDLYKACLRCGFASSVAIEYAKRFESDPYFQWCVRDNEEKALTLDANDKEIADTETRNRLIKQLEREAGYHGEGASHAARVQALKTLCGIYGLVEKVTKDNKPEQHTGVITVPSAVSAEDWEKVAAEQQLKIMKETDQ